jgi:hypothetical protein
MSRATSEERTEDDGSISDAYVFGRVPLDDGSDTSEQQQHQLISSGSSSALSSSGDRWLAPRIMRICQRRNVVCIVAASSSHFLSLTGMLPCLGELLATLC